ncbi:MAG: 50S ribosomal protein L28 [Alphaproteobacteria bacterium GM202ARS2]|nr:50S ribosomal protein L28 [Alphaproteobacteria bacterium GM202ARS2]
MTRQCAISGKKAQSGNNVSHAHNKTRRRFLPNIQTVSLFSQTLGHKVRLKATPRSVKTIEFHGGLDSWLAKKSLAQLQPNLRQLKKRIEKRLKSQMSSGASPVAPPSATPSGDSAKQPPS